VTGTHGARGAHRGGSGHSRGDSETFQELRPLMFSIAYRMLGSVSDAEDVVQEAFVPISRRSARAWTSRRRRRTCPRS